MPAQAILNQIRSLGYLVSTHDVKGSLWGTIPASVELHAVNPQTDPPQVFVARVDRQEPDAEYRAACALAKLVGVDL